jgi:hypothetical protein
MVALTLLFSGMRLRLFVPVLAAFLVGCLTGCGGDTLDYETAMNLLRERTTDPVRTSFNGSPHFETQEPSVTQAYQRLMDEHVIQCKKSVQVGTVCEPGPAGDALTQDGISELSLVAGRWVPASIVAIRRTGQNSAVADVRMSFEPSEIFREFESAFLLIQAPESTLALDGSHKQGKIVHVTFQRYGDGWHVESVE